MESHATFFLGNIAGKGNEVMYVIDLGSAFFISVLVEWLSRTRFVVVDNDDPAKNNSSNNVVAGLIQTGLYGIRTTLAYLVMLQVMSFDVWVLFMAVAGYSFGFLIFGSRVFYDEDKHGQRLLYQKPTDLPPLNC